MMHSFLFAFGYFLLAGFFGLVFLAQRWREFDAHNPRVWAAIFAAVITAQAAGLLAYWIFYDLAWQRQCIAVAGAGYLGHDFIERTFFSNKKPSQNQGDEP